MGYPDAIESEKKETKSALKKLSANFNHSRQQTDKDGQLKTPTLYWLSQRVSFNLQGNRSTGYNGVLKT